ncbi:hypothetical protein C2I18_02220 [Paenibacillus sp. PK3_47]|uniref:GNAT family N-acetyltransferase n=1 Tax=Paenibacillus sp. PK3_47 TaxID=2072642 RepID=UPI00201E0CEA|nr:GNAT family N-acetyltransferase [Paenibacillus sp. PK3_47]UQZ32471.1 hypothetical protein C2I18_02220 [Paenibacillus sp. PK3_47]
MFINFGVKDSILDSDEFRLEETRYNLIHRITGYDGVLNLKSADGRLILTQSPGFNPWLWISGKLVQSIRMDRAREAAEYLKEKDFPGVSAEAEVAEAFAKAYCKARGKLYHTYMILEAYYCPQVVQPQGVPGQPLTAGAEHIGLIAEFMARFVEDAFGRKEEREHFLPHAEEAVRSGIIHLWTIDGVPVSMAAVAHRSKRQARINDVYTPEKYRKHGYASALVAALCEGLLHEGLTPVLYADGSNPDSNKVYRSIGFTGAGTIAELKFE